MPIPASTFRPALLVLLGLCLGWAGHVLLGGGAPEAPPPADPETAETPPPLPPPTAAPEEPVMEQEFKMLAFADLNMKSLALVVEDRTGLAMQWPDTLDGVQFSDLDFAGMSLAEILMGLLGPEGYGFLKRDGTLEIVPLTRGPGNDLRAALKAAPGETTDLWLQSDPLISVRIIAQPLYGEGAEDEIVVALEGRRAQRPWFSHHVRTRLGEPAVVEARGEALTRWTATASNLNDNALDLEVVYHHATPQP